MNRTFIGDLNLFIVHCSCEAESLQQQQQAGERLTSARMYKIMEPKNQEITELGDRISQLPEALVHHILSFLQFKDAVNASVASKSFHNAWTTLPYLNFGKDCFPTLRIYGDKNEKIKKIHQFLEVADLMIRMRLEQKLSIHKFMIQLPGYLIDLSPYIDKVMDCITEANVKELVFEITNRLDKRYTLPEAVYAAKGLIKLELEGFKLDLPRGDVKLLSLRELYLSTTCLDNNLIQLLASSCPSLEVWDFKNCHGFDSFRILGAPKLKRIYLDNVDTFHDFKIDIQAPNLEYLYCYTNGKLMEVNLGGCTSLKELLLHKLIVPANWANDLLSNLPLLENLTLINCEGLEYFHTTSNCLKYLILWNCFNLVSLQLDTPNLSSFEYTGDVSINLSLKALAIEQLIVGPSDVIPWCQNKLLEFLGNFNHFKALTVRFWFQNMPIVAKDTRKSFYSPLYNVKFLTISPCRVEKSMFLDLLDTLLWIAPCLDSLTLKSNVTKRSLQFIHDKSQKDEGEDYSCCSSIPINCWRHSLMEVKCENMEKIADEEKLKSYFFENAKMFKSVDFA